MGFGEFTDVQASCLIVQSLSGHLVSTGTVSQRFKNDLSSRLAREIHLFAPDDGVHASPIPGVHCVRYSKVDRSTKRRWRACLGVVAQGSKEIVLGRTVYRFGAADF